jgi:phosphoglycerate-specific signal transduction histidine kinase
MAARFTTGKPAWRSRFLRSHWGVRGSLFAAFAVIAGMTLVISAGAAMVLGHLGRSMVDLSGRDIPRLAASLQLSAQSASLASQGPALLASRSEESLNERANKVKETQAVTLEKLGEVIELGADKAVVAALSETVKNIDGTIKSLVAAARERLEAAAQHEKQYDALRNAQVSFVAAASPAMLDAQLQINAILGSANLSQDDATQARADGRPARQCHRQRQPDGIGDDCRALGKQPRHARSHRKGIRGHASARQIELRFAAAKLRDQGAQGRSAEIAGAGRG